MLKFIVSANLLFILVFHTCGRTTPGFKFGFGTGINLSSVQELNAYPLYEDLTGLTYSSEYSQMFSNRGMQYFFHGELGLDRFVLAIKPGTYSYRFKKTDEIIFTSETREQQSSYLLRYFQIPVE